MLYSNKLRLMAISGFGIFGFIFSSSSTKMALCGILVVGAEEKIESTNVNDLGESDLPSPNVIHTEISLDDNRDLVSEYAPQSPSRIEALSPKSAPTSILDAQAESQDIKDCENTEVMSSEKSEQVEDILQIISPSDREYENMIKQFILWASENAGITSEVKIKHFDHGRGVAATRGLIVGDILLSVPFESLLSLASIENDPILQPILGRKAAIDNEIDDEFSLLGVFLLYHRSLGKASPISAYINVLRTAPVDSMPFMWSEARLQKLYPDPSNHIRLLTQDILDRIKEKRDTIIPYLLEEHSSIYTNPKQAADIFSFENFKWAFAILNSRHWHLPCNDLDNLTKAKAHDISDNTETKSNHIFLAPFADLVNFGPPCAKGAYNSESGTFDIVATCDFISGQEVTFWYTDSCEDYVIANYGFSHYLIKECLNSKELHERNDELEIELEESLDEIEELKTLLRSCSNIESHGRVPSSNAPSRLHEHRVRGNRGGVRKKPPEL